MDFDWNWAIYAIWGLLIVSLVFELKWARARLEALRRGISALKFLPLVWVTMAVTAVVALFLADKFPILNAGWLGVNIMMKPISDMAATEAATQTALDTTGIILLLTFFVIIVYACLACNYYEEAGFRESLLAVGVWAAIHLIMGIPIYAVIVIFYIGLIYKYVYDKYSVDHSYCLHFFTNLSLVTLIVVVMLLPSVFNLQI